VHGRPFWLRRINTVETFETLLAWAAETAAGGPAALPEPLAAHAFAWTGGGPGPHPPVEG
jgi:hypothetical protein